MNSAHNPRRPAFQGALLLAASVVTAPVWAQPNPISMPPLQLSRSLATVPSTHPTPTEIEAPPASNHWTAQAHQWQPGNSACADLASPSWERLTLSVALAHTLCKSPAMRLALAQVAEQAANVELGEAAKRARWSASAQYSNARNFDTSGQTERTLSASLGLSWVLFDFGQRSAELQSARKTLAAAMASQDNALLDAVREQLRLYGEAVVAHATLEATTEAEATAERTAAASRARFEAKVGSQIDRLQAQTALAQATLDRVRAQSTWNNTRAALALSLGADIAQPIRPVDWEIWADAPPERINVDQLQLEAEAQHPLLISKQAQIASLQSRLEAVRAQGKGSVSLSASAGPARNWSAGGRDTTTTGSAALVATIPLFSGRESDALQAQVVAQTQAREAEMEAVRRDIRSQVWQAHQALMTSQQSLAASVHLMASADNTYQVAQGRYRAGVGSMLELLNAQSALADARRQKVSAQVERLNARTGVGLAAGRIGAVAYRAQLPTGTR
jgi:outer membrane protein